MPSGYATFYPTPPPDRAARILPRGSVRRQWQWPAIPTADQAGPRGATEPMVSAASRSRNARDCTLLSWVPGGSTAQ